MKKLNLRNFNPNQADNLHMRISLRSLVILFAILFLCATQYQCSVIDKIMGGTEVGSPSISDVPPDSPSDDDVGDNNSNDDTSDTEVSNEFTTLALGTDGDTSVSAHKQYITSQTALQTAWETLFPSETAPVVDFNDYTVAFIVMGAQSNAAHSIEVTEIETTDIDFDIYVTETATSGDCITAQVITNPYHIVLIDKNSESLRRHFVTENVIESCD